MEDAPKGNESPAWQTDEFRIYEFKVKRCSRSRPHDWTCCPFAHNGEKAKRRDPRRFAYTGAACPDYRKNASCRRGDKCPFAHGVFESWLHPSRYRTQCCTDGAACKRRVCFFAHHESELRKPEDDPALLEAQLQAEALASTEQYQQILAAASLEMVAEAAPTNSPTQLNLALLQALLQNSGTALAPVSWAADGDAQERLRLLQLQHLLAALQLRNAPPQPPPQRSPSQNSDPLSALDTAALGRLLAANQALVQRQAEQEMLQRSSFEAARRNSISCDAPLDPSGSGQFRPDAHPGSTGSLDYGRGPSEASRQASMRRMSMDNIGSQRHSGSAGSQQGLDPRILAALAMSQRTGMANHALAQAEGGRADPQSLRRSVDLGSLAHGARGCAGGSSSDLNRQLLETTMNWQRAEAACRAGGSLNSAQPQAPATASAFASAFQQHLDGSGGGLLGVEQQQAGQAMMDQAPINAVPLQSHNSGLRQAGSGYDGFMQQMDSQDSEQLQRYAAELAGQPPEQLGTFSGQPGSFSGQPSGQLSGQSSAQYRQPPLHGQGSGCPGSLPGAFLPGQDSGQLGGGGSFSLLDMHARQQPQPQRQSHYSPGPHLMSSVGSGGRISEQQYHMGASMAANIAASGWPSGGQASAAVAVAAAGHAAAQGGDPGPGRPQRMRSGSAGSLKLPLQDEESARLGEELFGQPSGGSTPSRGTPTPTGKYSGGLPPNQGLPSPCDFVHVSASSAYTSSPGLNGSSTAYDTSTRSSSLNMVFSSPPSIPEEGPAWGHNQLSAPGDSGFPSTKGRMMPTLLEQLQFFDAQRHASAPLLDAPLPVQLAIARNTSFESLSAELPRSISDLNLEAQAAAPNQAPTSMAVSGR